MSRGYEKGKVWLIQFLQLKDIEKSVAKVMQLRRYWWKTLGAWPK